MKSIIKVTLKVTLAAPAKVGRAAPLLVLFAAPLAGCSLFSFSTPSANTPSPIQALAVTQPGERVALRSSDALEAARLLEREAVQPESVLGDAEFRREQAQGLAGDRQAAMHVARMYADGSNGVPHDERRMVQWLKHASLLDHGGASYQLYLYYLARGLDRDAVRYEQRALRQGYVLPARLDNRRG